MRNFDKFRYILLLGSAASTLLLIVCIGYISGVFSNGDTMHTESVVNALALLSQNVLKVTVFVAIAYDIVSFNIKKPNEN